MRASCPERQERALALERHLGWKLGGCEPGELFDVVGAARFAIGVDDPGETQRELLVIGIDEGAQQLDGLDLEPRLLPELPPQTLERFFAFLEEAAGEVPVTAPWLDSAPAEQDAAVTLQQPLDGGRGIRPETGAACRARAVVPSMRLEVVPAAWTELPAGENAHPESIRVTAPGPRGRATPPRGLETIGLTHTNRPRSQGWVRTLKGSLPAQRGRWMPGRPALVGLAAAAALVALAMSPVSAALSVTSGYFETPSHNIVCGYFAGSGIPALLECGVASGLVPSAPKPAEGACRVVDPVSDRVRLNATGRTYGFCSGDVGVLAKQGLAPVLQYGRTWHEGPYRCSSASVGLTCKNSEGHGFFLSRQSWHAF